MNFLGQAGIQAGLAGPGGACRPRPGPRHLQFFLTYAI